MNNQTATVKPIEEPVDELAALEARLVEHYRRRDLELTLLRNLRGVAARHRDAINREDMADLIQTDTEMVQCLDELDREFPVN